jgi:hypothetical protein
VFVQGRRAHAGFRRHGIDAEGLAVIALDPADGAVDLLQLAFGERDLPQLRCLVAEQQPIQDFPFRERREDRDVARSGQQPHQTDGGVQQLGRDAAERQGRPRSIARSSRRVGFEHQGADHRRVEV